MAEPWCEPKKPDSRTHDLNHCCLFSTLGCSPDGKEIESTMKTDGLPYLTTMIQALAIKVDPGVSKFTKSWFTTSSAGPKAQLSCGKIREAFSRQESTSGLRVQPWTYYLTFHSRKESKYLCGSCYRTQEISLMTAIIPMANDRHCSKAYRGTRVSASQKDNQAWPAWISG